MAKRFTDTDKWSKATFSDLSLKMKLVWIYLCDRSNHAGIWDLNLSLMSFQIGTKVTLEEIQETFGDKIQVHGSKIFIPSFVEFQYGELNPDNRAHKSVIAQLEKLSINKPLEAPPKGLVSPSQGDKDMDMDQDMDKDNSSLKKPELHWLAAVWNSSVTSLPKVSSIGKARQKQIDLAIEKRPDQEQWKVICTNVEESDFLSGRNGVWSNCGFDWILNEKNSIKVFEGNYKNKTSLGPTGKPPRSDGSQYRGIGE